MSPQQPARLDSESHDKKPVGLEAGDARPPLRIVRPEDAPPQPPGKTGSGRKVDAIIGIALPLLMLFFDPAVFRTGIFGQAALYGVFKPGAYVATFCFIVLMGIWIRRQPWPAFMSGALAAGVVFALAMGCAILPTSVIGILLFGLGLLGLTPFLMAYIYWRNAREAFRLVRARGFRPPDWIIAASGFALPLTLAVGSQIGVNSIFQGCSVAIADGRPKAAMRTLRVISPLVDTDDLMRDYLVEKDPVRKKRLGDAFLDLTGDTPEDRYRMVD
jgi:hypothetical protein